MDAGTATLVHMLLPRLLVFDLDGTLIDSSLDLCNSINATLEHAGKATLPHALIASYIGDGAAMLVRRALGDPGDLDALDPANPAGEHLFHRAFDFFLEYYHDHKLDNTRVYDGVLEALSIIRAAHPTLPMAVLTNKPVIPSRQICAALGLAPFFFQNYGGNSFATKKPDPAGLLTVISEAGSLMGSAISPADVVMIGDSDIDVLTGRRAGARSLACTFGLAPHTLSAAQPDLSVDHPSEWPRTLGLA
jgi:phosphoglycolate phosphatase